jgi:class 3 adenylate cyclase
VLNGFFGAASAVVDTHGGVVVNHVGDGLIVSFNAPLPVVQHAAQALHTLVAGQTFEGHHLDLRIGVATGPVATGQSEVQIARRIRCTATP